MSADNGIEKMKNTSESSATESAPQISEAINKLLENPELIGMVASVLGGAKPKAAGEGERDTGEANDSVQESAPASTAPAQDIISSLAPVISAMQRGQGTLRSDPAGDKRACLLVALKPYLCRERCEAIDYMVRLGKLSELFKTLY